MSSPKFTVYQMPPMANPEMLNSVAELRRELHRTNRELMAVSLREQTANDQGLELMKTLYKALLLHVKGAGELTGYLDAYLNEWPRLREKLEEALESAADTKVH